MNSKHYYYLVLFSLVASLAIVVGIGSCMLGSKLYLWSIIFYLFSFSLFNKETEMGDISIISLFLPFLPFLNIVVALLTISSTINFKNHILKAKRKRIG